MYSPFTQEHCLYYVDVISVQLPLLVNSWRNSHWVGASTGCL